ncbi:MAG: 3-deoxy-manno-octulosonate cytidylyltransferase [Gammaproteobacteria bacterium]|nr:3-deoxy-manno-octulosonate cytidylyltransferase [Gammaproteobacteria bacterium]|tara:strand:+ start:1305 stop:2048 length:744 start_codon:yes stop_codon:yes gene_type:complete
MSFVVVIPARYHSTRLPGKPLLEIAGKSMIQRAWEGAKQSSADAVIIATDDQRIYQAVRDFGADVEMTSIDHSSGSDRVQEVVQKLGFSSDQIVVNVQGDEPLLPSGLIDQVAINLKNTPPAGIATLASVLTKEPEFNNPSVVKVVRDKNGFALYFSRSPIPQSLTFKSVDVAFKHIGIYAYRLGVLNRFVRYPIGDLERVERLEQLRALENGIQIHVGIVKHDLPKGVDTQADLEHARDYFVSAQS